VHEVSGTLNEVKSVISTKILYLKCPTAVFRQARLQSNAIDRAALPDANAVAAVQQAQILLLRAAKGGQKKKKGNKEKKKICTHWRRDVFVFWLYK